MTCYIFLSRRLVASSGKAAHNQQFINFPTPNEIPNAKYRFFQIGGLPGVIGTIDCTHLKLCCPGGPNFTEIGKDIVLSMYTLSVAMT